MIFTKEQKKEAYKKLSPEVQDFIMDPETTEVIENLLTEAGLNEEQSIQADTEILNAMYGLVNISDLIKNIAQITGRGEGELSTLKSNLVTNIFSVIDKIKSSNNVVPTFVEIIPIITQISQKYGLNQTQQDILVKIIEDQFENGSISGKEDEISERLNVSKLLAEQIVLDINKRVFEQKSKVKEIVSEEKTVSNERLMSAGTQLELKPDNLPVVEVNEPLKVIPVPKPVFQNEVLDKQVPIGVPRYAETAKPNFINPVIEKKINTITSSPAPVKYEKDPYREPLS